MKNYAGMILGEDGFYLGICSTECYGIWGRNMEMGRKRGIRKDNDNLCKMVIRLFGLEFYI